MHGLNSTQYNCGVMDSENIYSIHAESEGSLILYSLSKE